jgi:hypothetical protein
MLPIPLGSASRAFPVAVLAAIAGGGPVFASEAMDAIADSAIVTRGADPAFPEIEIPRYIFAAEDTLEMPALFHMSEVEIQAGRLTIGDIVSRCIESEERLRERIESLVYTQTVRTVMHVDGYGESARKQMILEQADRVFFRKPSDHRTVSLANEQYVLEDGGRRPWEDQENETVRIEYEELQELPFYLEERDGYDFEILSREIVGERVIYEVRLTPRSDFEIAPEGTIWVDTSSFSILREEFHFGDRVPLPMFVKSVGPFIRERERIGDVWVWKRFLVRADLRMGWLRVFDDDIPDTVEFMVHFRDHKVNEGWETTPVVEVTER